MKFTRVIPTVWRDPLMTQVLFKIIYFTQEEKFPFLGGSIVERTHPRGAEFVIPQSTWFVNPEFPVGFLRLCGQHGLLRKWSPRAVEHLSSWGRWNTHLKSLQVKSHFHLSRLRNVWEGCRILLIHLILVYRISNHKRNYSVRISEGRNNSIICCAKYFKIK